MIEQNNLNEGANKGSNLERYGLKPYRKRLTSGKKIAIALLAIVVIISGAASISFSSFMKPHHDGGPLMMMLEKITKDLNLSNDQKTQVQTIKDEIKAKMESKKKENKQSGMDDFANAFKQDKLDKETLKSIQEKHETDREEMKEFFMDELIKFHDILTSDQRAQVVTKMQDMRKNHDMWKDKDKDKNPNN